MVPPPPITIVLEKCYIYIYTHTSLSPFLVLFPVAILNGNEFVKMKKQWVGFRDNLRFEPPWRFHGEKNRRFSSAKLICHHI